MTSVIQTVVQKVENFDGEATQRPVVFGQQEQEESLDKFNNDLDRLKVVTGDLIDLWLFEGSRGVKYL